MDKNKGACWLKRHPGWSCKTCDYKNTEDGCGKAKKKDKKDKKRQKKTKKDWAK